MRAACGLVCLTTLALDEAHYGGAITVTREPVRWQDDPFARIFPGTVVRSDLFCPSRRPPALWWSATPGRLAGRHVRPVSGAYDELR